MKYVLLVWLLIGGIGEGIYCFAQNVEKVIRNGMPWFDDHGNIVNAHGACIVEERGGIICLVSGNQMKAMLFRDFLATLRMTWLTGSSSG